MLMKPSERISAAEPAGGGDYDLEREQWRRAYKELVARGFEIATSQRRQLADLLGVSITDDDKSLPPWDELMGMVKMLLRVHGLGRGVSYTPEPDDTGDALEPTTATCLNPEAIGDPDTVPIVQLPQEFADALVESGQCVRVDEDDGWSEP